MVERQNVLVTGATGNGKTYVACALAQQACRKGYRALYRRVPRLFEELTLAHADGTYARLLARLAKVDVLVLDDWGLAPLNERERRDQLEIIDDRHGNRSTITTSQVDPKLWHDQHLLSFSVPRDGIEPPTRGFSVLLVEPRSPRRNGR